MFSSRSSDRSIKQNQIQLIHRLQSLTACGSRGLLHSLHLRHLWLSQRSLPVHRRQKDISGINICSGSKYMVVLWTLDWIVQCFTSPPTQYRLYGRRFLQVKRPNQQYQSTEGKSTKDKSNNGNNTKQTCIDNNRDE